MARIIISGQNQQQLFELRYASNITWRKSLNGIGYASFDLPLSDPYAQPSYLHAGAYVHIYNDSVSSLSFANADWGGILANDYEIKPRDGVISLSAAGLAQLLQLSIVTMTTDYSGLDLGSIVSSLITTRDNAAAVPMSAYTVSTLGPTVNQFIAGFGDPVMADIQKLMTGYGCDFEVRPDFSYAFYIRQGADHFDYVARYGGQGNVKTDSSMHLVNTEMGNQIYYVGNSTTVFVANQSSAQYYGKKTLVIQDDGTTYNNVDVQTKAQLELAKRAYPLFVLDHVKLVDTPLLPFAKVQLGDRITFEAPGMPLLQSFNGPQRILAIDYNDKQRIMDLTLGNAVYVILRGKLHELRLYN